MYKYIAGFIGAGSMGGALAQNVCEKAGCDNIAVVCSNEQSTQVAAKRLGCNSSSLNSVAADSKFVFLGVKPQNLNSVADVVKENICKNGGIVVSMLAGVTLSRLCDVCGTNRVIRIMPNVACAVSCGMTLVCAADGISADELSEFCDLISLSGKTDIIDEKLIDAASALAGCGPAFVFQFIEALADGAVKCGLPRTKAYEYAEQTLLGSSKLALETGSHPAQLKDSVCSPGGSTIEGIAALEENCFRNAVIAAVTASFDKTKKLGKA